MTEGRRFKRKVMIWAAGLGGIACVGTLLWTGREDMALGWVVGTLVSILNFHLMAGEVLTGVWVRTGKGGGGRGRPVFSALWDDRLAVGGPVQADEPSRGDYVGWTARRAGCDLWMGGGKGCGGKNNEQ